MQLFPKSGGGGSGGTPGGALLATVYWAVADYSVPNLGMSTWSQVTSPGPLDVGISFDNSVLNLTYATVVLECSWQMESGASAVWDGMGRLGMYDVQIATMYPFQNTMRKGGSASDFLAAPFYGAILAPMTPGITNEFRLRAAWSVLAGTPLCKIIMAAERELRLTLYAASDPA